MPVSEAYEQPDDSCESRMALHDRPLCLFQKQYSMSA